MTTVREAAQMALQALQESKPIDINDPTAFYRSAHAIEALRAALAQPEPEPVAWADKYDIQREGHDFWVSRQQPAKNGAPLYTAPPQREWQGLTDEEIEKIVYNIKSVTMGIVTTEYLARAIEAKLKEKNNDKS